MKVLRAAVTGVMIGIVLPSIGHAQDRPLGRETRIWTGLSLGTEDSSLTQRMFSTGGLTRTLSYSGTSTIDVYVDALRLVERPVAISGAGTVTSNLFGLGFAWTFHKRDLAGTATYFGYGLGVYRDRKTDTRVHAGAKESTDIGGKLFVGTSVGGPYFLQGQFSILTNHKDLQLGVGRRF